MRRLATALLAALALLGAALDAPEAAPRQAHAEETSAVCTGVAASDALLPACGVSLTREAYRLTWPGGSTPIVSALAAPRLAFRGPPPGPTARAIDWLTVWQHDDSTGAWRTWSSQASGAFATLETFEPGGVYALVATADLDLSLAPLRVSVLAGTRIVSIYGHPGVPTMGALGLYASADAAADAAQEVARPYVALSGATRVVPALHLIASVAQADPGWDGTYLGRMSIADIRPWVDATRARGELLFLDVQVGWSDPLVEVQRLEPVLREAHVHVALDPEFATRGKNDPPGEAIGFLVPEQVNSVQHYLADLVAREALPSKVLVLHQFRYDMLHDPQRIERVSGVDVVIDMDGWGPPEQKLDGYRLFALSSYAPYAGFKLFYRWDQPLLTPEQVMALPRPPDYVINQ